MSKKSMALTMASESTGQEEVGLQVGKASSRACHGVGDGRREHMFEKVVTPSDVGKLNRLVVPKHFAEKYFPLGPAARGSPVGAVLCFEDARGGGVDEPAGAKAWRFRYCYWRSSQSYVMTKGWSLFVRDKHLAAGDVVSFFRAGGRLFIDCRRRGAAAAPLVLPVVAPPENFTVQRLVTATTTTASGRGRCLRLFGVDLELGSEEPLLPDLQLALR